ncbi:hypothetical protein DXB08_34330 [Hungatella hathewayi]|uniref:hypothetical protein n=1 Tax=Hungatella hathewayi TaxID=154046 RepID=UPI000E44A7E0|nr:hypothetical protein [Hungatella hathewayi]RGO62045.1 hypothetical protein DXB08_34330 [Hungatella hathewayi]
MTNIDDYKQKKIEEAFQEEDKVHDDLEVKLKRVDIKDENGREKTSNAELLELLKDLKPAREKTMKAIQKYGEKRAD